MNEEPIPNRKLIELSKSVKHHHEAEEKILNEIIQFARENHLPSNIVKTTLVAAGYTPAAAGAIASRITKYDKET